MELRPLKILQLTSQRNVNGAAYYCGLLSRQLAQAGHDVTVMTRPGVWFTERLGNSLETEQPSGVLEFDRLAVEPKTDSEGDRGTPIRTPIRCADGIGFSVAHSTFRRSPGEIRRVAAWIRRQQFDLIHTHVSSAHTLGIIMKWLTGVPCIATAHHCHLQLHWPLNDFVIANSDYTKRYHQRLHRIPSDRIETVYCYTDLDAFLSESSQSPGWVRRQQMVPTDVKTIGVIGEICRRKGHLHFARALPQLLKSFPDLLVLFVGSYGDPRDPYLRAVQRELCRNGSFPRVRWLGRREDIPRLVKSLDVCVIPSEREPLGLVAIEASAAGTPVVATDVGGLPEIIRHEQTGLLIPPRNPQAIHQAVASLLSDPARARDLAEHGRQWVSEKFAPPRLTAQVEQIYRTVLARTGKGESAQLSRAA